MRTIFGKITQDHLNDAAEETTLQKDAAEIVKENCESSLASDSETPEPSWFGTRALASKGAVPTEGKPMNELPTDGCFPRAKCAKRCPWQDKCCCLPVAAKCGLIYPDGVASIERLAWASKLLQSAFQKTDSPAESSPNDLENIAMKSLVCEVPM